MIETDLQKLIFKCANFYSLARKSEDLSILKANIGNYIHFSNSERFGISYHKDIHPGNPRGVYGFPLTATIYQRIVENKPEIIERIFYDYGYSKYIYIFSVKGNILDIDNVNLEELTNKVRNFVRTTYSKSGKDLSGLLSSPSSRLNLSDGSQFLRWIDQISKDIFKNEHSGVNIILRGIGYDAIETKNYGFDDDLHSEIAVLNPTAINLIAKITNPILTKEDIKEIDWVMSDEYKEQQKQKEIERNKKSEERLNLLKSLDKKKEDLDKMEQELKEYRKKNGPTPEYLEKIDQHLQLTKDLNIQRKEVLDRLNY
jgi:hypothetical protein